jgi:hypothetical protein
MLEFFLAPSNTPFVIALTIMMAITIIEIISASLGMGLSEMVDSFLPEFDTDIDIDADADVDIDVAGAGGPGDSLVKLLAWFRVGEVPVIMLFIVFLTGFGLSGLIIQFLLVTILNTTVPATLAAIPAMLCSIFVVRVCGGILGKYLPKDETYAVSEESFPGMVATLTLGTAKKGKPAEAKLKDEHGQTHYILVEPDNEEECFSQGDKTIIVSKNGAIYKIIAATNTAMTDE